MDRDELLRRTRDYVRDTLHIDSSGHDWWHVYRVWQTAIQIARAEGADLFVVELAALLHDIADWKFHDGDDTAGPRTTREWLSSLNVPTEIVGQVAAIIEGLSFKGAGVPTDMPTLEGKIVQDADRLDALGAVGIARAFAYGGHAGRAMYDPDAPPQLHESFAAYKQNHGPTINHFYEKLLLLRDRMQTDTGRRMAAERHEFLRRFLEQFFREWHVNEPPPEWTRIND